jgi:G3E family GTPase
VLDTSTAEHEGPEQQAERVDPDHAHQHHDITSFCLTYYTPFDLQKLGHELLVLLNIYRHQVYRVKGIIETQDNPVRVVLQSVRTQMVLTDGTPWEEDMPRTGKIVFIGKGVHRESIERILNRCLVQPAPPPQRRVFAPQISGNPALNTQNIKFG